MLGVKTTTILLAVLCLVLRSSEPGSSEDESIQRLLTAVGQEATASVDGDPDFIVGVQGMEQPLCFRIEGEPGQVVRLLQDPDTGVVVNARITRPLPGSRKTYLGAVLIARHNFRMVAKVGRVLVNKYRFPWGPVSVRLVHGHRVLIAPTLMALTLRNKNVTLIVKRHLPEGGSRTEDDDDNSADNEIDDGGGGEYANNANTLSWAARGTDLDRGPHPGDDASVLGNDFPESRGHQNDANQRRHRRRRRRRNHRRPGRRISRNSASARLSRRRGRVSADGSTPAQDGRSSSGVPTVVDMSFPRERRRAQSRLNADPSSRRSQSRSRPAGQTAPSGRPESGPPIEVAGEGSASGSGVRSHLRPSEAAAYVGFYVSDARDLSPETHGLLGQFLHKTVQLRRVRRKPNGVVKARLLVQRPRPHEVKATLRTRRNLALNTSSACWWLKDGGMGVVDGTYTDYLVPRFRATDMLPLPSTMMSQ